MDARTGRTPQGRDERASSLALAARARFRHWLDERARERAPESLGPLAESAQRDQTSLHHPSGESVDDAPEGEPSTVVGVAASLAGLDVLTALLGALDHPADLALLVRLDGDGPTPTVVHELAERSSLEVEVAGIAGPTPIAAGHVYLVSPGVVLSRPGGRLAFTRAAEGTSARPIDAFFHALAAHVRSDAVGVVLSVASGDGAEGLRAIKGAGGVTFAWDPSPALLGSLDPADPADQGAVDLVLQPAQIAVELSRLCEYAKIVRSRTEDAANGEVSEEDLRRVTSTVHELCGVDLDRYKAPVLRRWIRRRMRITEAPSIAEYLALLERKPTEGRALSGDIRAHTRRFFRDPEAFAALRERVFPALRERRGDAGPLRVWVPGCSTGEDVYSLAIELLDFFGGAPPFPVQIFGTDLDPSVIARARSATYPEGIAADVPRARLDGFFTRVGADYRVAQAVRDLCVFAPHDVVRDPPFGRLDLILCRDLLIYMTRAAQQRVAGSFHYALKPGAFLMLANAEVLAPDDALFTLADREHRIYVRRRGSWSGLAAAGGVASALVPPTPEPTEAARVLLDRYAPPAVVVDGRLHAIEFHGQMGRFLELAGGEPTLNLVALARGRLGHSLRELMRQVKRAARPVRRRGLTFPVDGGVGLVDVEVVPLSGEPGDPHYLVVFEEQRTLPISTDAHGRREKDHRGPSTKTSLGARVRSLEAELASSREQLAAAVDELELAHRTAGLVKDALQASGEDLQVRNEELLTTRDELEAANDEMGATNAALCAENEASSQASDELLCILDTVECAAVVVTRDLRIRRFTPRTARFFNLRSTDLGRPLGHLRPRFDRLDLAELVERVIDSGTPYDGEVRDAEGHRHRLRIRPYRDVEDTPDGAVLALTDAGRAEGAPSRETLIVLDGELRIRLLTDPLGTCIAPPAQEALGRRLTDLGEPWTDRDLIKKLEALRDGVARGSWSDALELDHARPGAERVRLVLDAMSIDGSTPHDSRILLVVRER